AEFSVTLGAGARCVFSSSLGLCRVREFGLASRSKLPIGLECDLESGITGGILILDL
uniref:Uncharacterized protein n=1 Tax=Cannabis sativa TaxID=3483 RepID=A0A803QRL5_CANSA